MVDLFKRSTNKKLQRKTSDRLWPSRLPILESRLRITSAAMSLSPSLPPFWWSLHIFTVDSIGQKNLSVCGAEQQRPAWNKIAGKRARFLKETTLYWTIQLYLHSQTTKDSYSTHYNSKSGCTSTSCQELSLHFNRWSTRWQNCIWKQWGKIKIRNLQKEWHNKIHIILCCQFFFTSPRMVLLGHSAATCNHAWWKTRWKSVLLQCGKCITDSPAAWVVYEVYIYKGSLEVKLLTIWRDETQRREE